MLKNIARSPLQKLLLISALILSILLHYPQPTFDLPYYKSLASDYAASSDKDAPLKGINIVITGATSGLGLDLAKTLHGLGGTVIAVGRSEKKLSKLVEDVDTTIMNANRNEKDNRIVPIIADFQDLEAVASAASEIRSKFKTIDFLVNNAGMHYHTHGLERPTPQGYDMAFAVNYLSHFLLTEKLLPSGLEQSKLANGSRIIQISSSFHMIVTGDDLVPSMDMPSSIIAAQPSYSYLHSIRSYGNSKLAQIYHARALNREIANAMKSSKNSSVRVRAVSLCPSWVATKILGDNARGLLDIFGFSSDGFGIAPVLFAMFHPDVSEINDYVSNCKRLAYIIEPILRLLPIKYYRETASLVGSFCFVFIQKLFADVGYRKSFSVGYDIEKQDALFKWSKEAIKPWI